MLPENNLEGRTAIVTGASRGIGREIALVLAEAGADIVAAARTRADIEATAADVKAMGRDVIYIATDVTKSSDVDAMVDRALEHFAKIDILVNVAGKLTVLPVVPLPDETLSPPAVDRESSTRMTDEEWHIMLQTNVTSAFYCCRAIAPHMIERRYGKIINLSSNASVQAYPMVSSYNAAKAGVDMMTRSLALEWAPYNICVNAIAPGAYRTAMTEHMYNDPVELQRETEGIPFRRWGDLRELGVLAVYLASAASDYMTGQIVHMDGGMTAR